MTDEMSLANLTSMLPDPDTIRARVAETEAGYQKLKDQFGDGWVDELRRRNNEEARKLKRKDINTMIYHNGVYPIDGFTKLDVEKPDIDMFNERLLEVYGDCYDNLRANRSKNDPRVAELLIQDAIRTGLWDELPDELQAAYHERAGAAR